jgi:hypothetical protein
MSPPPKVDLKALIAGDVAPAVMMDDPPPPALPLEPERVVAFHQPPPLPTTRPPRLKERTHAVSVYLEPPVFERLRVLAFEERTKMHTLMLEAVDLLIKKRGQPSIKKLVGAGTPGYQDAVRRERSDARNR